jgi:hypothetical protein
VRAGAYWLRIGRAGVKTARASGLAASRDIAYPRAMMRRRAATTAIVVLLGFGCGTSETSPSAGPGAAVDAGKDSHADGGGSDAAAGAGGSAGSQGQGGTAASGGSSGASGAGGSAGEAAAAGAGGDGCVPVPEVCGNGVDDDCDGATDCRDFQCGGTTACKCAVEPVPTSTGSRDIVFAAVGDVHSGDADAVKGDAALVTALGSITAHAWPTGYAKAPGNYDKIRGVVLVGDLTDTGDTDPKQSQILRDTFGRCGDEGKLGFPVYDGYGNHDVPWVAKDPANLHVHPVIDVLDEMAKNKTRPGDADRLYYDPLSAGSGHYAWKWDDIWFVHLNISPGSTVTYRDQATHDECSWPCSGTCNPPACGDTIRFVDPHNATDFFRRFVKSLTLSTKRQIVVISHFPFGSSWWPDADRTEFCNVIDEYRAGANQRLSASRPVAAFLHGHTHDLPVYEGYKTCGGITFAQFNVGSPVCSVQIGDADCACPTGSTDPACPAGERKFAHFTIFRLGANWLESVGVNARIGDATTWHITDKNRTQLQDMQ